MSVIKGTGCDPEPPPVRLIYSRCRKVLIGLRSLIKRSVTLDLEKTWVSILVRPGVPMK